ncbi:MAG: PepSY-associated TM helix domain-containing protein [Novosphingobium sp.]
MIGRSALYRTIWRWHFYAGLFVVPMVLVLALTGATYLFKPQVDRWEERHFRALPAAGAVSPDDQVKAALAAFPGARLQSYRLPEADGDAALVHVALPGKGGAMRDVFASPQGQVVGALDPAWRIMQIAHDIHGQLLLGPRGSWLVELAASWAIVMLISGLYLWWPAGRGLAGVVWPRLTAGSRLFWRDLHAVTGFWVAGLALVLLLTGLPWADVWGSAFKAVRIEMGWVRGVQDWTVGGRPAGSGEHAEHNHAAMIAGTRAMPAKAHVMPDGTVMTAAMTPVSLGRIVAEARSEHLPFPVIVTPPGAAQAPWSVRSDTQNRPLRVTLTYDAMTGKRLSREAFADKHPIDRVIGYGVAWHEGQLLGPINQLIGVATALMLVTLAVSGFVLWRRRAPPGRLGAPPAPATPAKLRGVAVVVIALAAFLPLLAASLIVMVLLERLVLTRIPGLARWLGIDRPEVSRTDPA